MGYIENPKTKGSGILCCIPQEGECPNKCPDCFFQTGRSYLEPLSENLPNMPEIAQVGYRVVRVNDGNDSNVKIGQVLQMTFPYPLKFYNTALPRNLVQFKAPVVLTLNPGLGTDTKYHQLDEIPTNLMFVRARVNTWNLDLVDKIVDDYTSRNVAVVLTFMAYYSQTVKRPEDYEWKVRTLNSYWVLKDQKREEIEDKYRHNSFVYSCGWRGTHACERCGTCLREFYATMERMNEKE